MKEKLEMILNTMARISTRGDDTLLMASCLNALREEIVALNQKEQEETDKTEKKKA